MCALQIFCIIICIIIYIQCSTCTVKEELVGHLNSVHMYVNEKGTVDMYFTPVSIS